MSDAAKAQGSPDPTQSDESIYEELVDHAHVDDAGHWAFGTDFEDPLAGVDTTLPDGVDGDDLADYCLMLGDDALIASHRLSEWCSRAPELEDDIALANIALDLLGQARLLLARAAAARELKADVRPPEDTLAHFRDAHDFKNVRLVEVENGDFGETVARLLIFSSVRLALLQRLTESRDHVLAAVGEKGVKEVTYHRDYAARWFVTLARGTEESRRRVLAGLDQVWPYLDEIFRPDPVESRLAEQGVGVDPGALRGDVEAVLDQVFEAAGIGSPEIAPMAAIGGRTGRQGLHTESLSRLLATMQSVARAHPEGRW